MAQSVALTQNLNLIEASGEKPRRVAILGVPIVNLTMDQTIAVIEQMIETGRFHQIATANADFLVKAIRDPELMAILQRCDLVLADGMPLLWASRLMGTPISERVCGSDLVPRLVELSAKKKYGIFILGASEERSSGAALWIEKNHPDARLVGRYSPPFAPVEEMDHEHILRLVNEAQPDILLVAFGNPKQEKWLAMNRHTLQVPVCVGVGASIDFLSGQHSRAPQWMQNSGLEWVHRMLKEPTRLMSRYWSNAVGLATHLPGQLLAYALQSRASTPSVVSYSQSTGLLRVAISGRFAGSVVGDVQDLLSERLEESRHLILDLEATSSIGPDAAGMIIHLGGWMHAHGRQVWLIGANQSVLRAHRASGTNNHILLAPDMTVALSRIGLSGIEAAA